MQAISMAMPMVDIVDVGKVIMEMPEAAVFMIMCMVCMRRGTFHMLVGMLADSPF